ncbi:unnamed protein product [Fraxinus pennsylvanica]|uniref:Uncharacterized protein n=1 Tax=Fraxinus pennsylvanica TaxID=56036 RepID=A0AAD1ZNR2_9LAMI|nr:unnamed protein product [Fraxinus pennsylvanica]
MQCMVNGDAVYWETTISSFLDDYRPFEGIMIAHSGRSAVTLFLFGEMAMSHSKTRMEETWTIEEVIDLNSLFDFYIHMVEQIVLLLRLVPLLPFNMLNYLLSVTPVSIGHYMLASWLGMMPITFALVYVGTTLKDLSDVTHGWGEFSKTCWVRALWCSFVWF